MQTQVFTAALGFTGSIAKSVARQQSAALGFAGSIAKKISIPFMAVLAFVGNAAKGMSQALVAALSFVGSIGTFEPVLPQYIVVLPLPAELPEIPVIPSQQLITAGDSGVIFFCHAGGFIMSPFYHTAKLLIQYQAVPAPAHIAYPLSIDPDGLTAHFTLYGTEFPVGGIYNLQLVVTGGNSMYSSPTVNIRVNDDITP
jgi:hypothetical protein